MLRKRCKFLRKSKSTFFGSCFCQLGMARYHNFGFGTIPECSTLECGVCVRARVSNTQARIRLSRLFTFLFDITKVSIHKPCCVLAVLAQKITWFSYQALLDRLFRARASDVTLRAQKKCTSDHQ